MLCGVVVVGTIVAEGETVACSKMVGLGRRFERVNEPSMKGVSNLPGREASLLAKADQFGNEGNKRMSAR